MLGNPGPPEPPEVLSLGHPGLLSPQGVPPRPPSSKGRIQDVAEQKLAGLLMPQDGNGEPQVMDLWKGDNQNWWRKPGDSGQGQVLPYLQAKVRDDGREPVQPQ